MFTYNYSKVMQNIQKNAEKLFCSFHKIMKMKKKYTDSYRLFVLKSNRKENQEKMFEVLGFTREQAYNQFGFLLNAFKYGVPPHAGLAYGLDRMVMLMAKEDSIREVIAFPKVKDASCLMTEAPGTVDEKQLEELGLAIDLPEETTEEE